MPIAQISGASLGALRKPPVSEPVDGEIDRGAENHRSQQREDEDTEDSNVGIRVTPVAATIVNAKNAPIMKTSPWAKLINSTMP